MPRETRIRVIGGLLGPLDARELRDVRMALEEWLEDNRDADVSRIRSVEAASGYFKNLLQTGVTGS